MKRQSLPRWRYHAHAAFTLIEVLVVVAIIALLVAILLPSLQEARRAARTSMCASNLKQCSMGIELSRAETRWEKERVSTNYGWAVDSLKQNNNQVGIFTCPDDPDPKPIPAVWCDYFWGTGNSPDLDGTVSPDGIYSRWKHISGDTWRVDVQDSVHQKNFGGDASSSSDIDLELEYNVIEGATSGRIKVSQKESAYNFRVRSYKGEVLFTLVGNSSGKNEVATPIIWMSYGSNSIAGLRNVKGNPILLAEGAKPGFFPLKLGAYPPEDTPAKLAKGLRFRHGSKAAGVEELKGYDFTKPGHHVSSTAPDTGYVPHQRMNTAFLDGHIETMHYSEVLQPETKLWRGSGRYLGSNTIFD